MDDALDFASFEVPDRLPLLDKGKHQTGSGKACVMEAASWLAGEPWSDHPRVVHRVIAKVAIAVNGTVSDAERQTLWPLLLASLGTGRRLRPLLYWRLQRTARRTRTQLGGANARELWEAVLIEHFRLTKRHTTFGGAIRLGDFEYHLRASARPASHGGLC